jgi:hypothetical protein
MTCVLTPGQRHEALGFIPVMERGVVKRPRSGRPKRRPGRVVGNKAYSSGRIRQYLYCHGSRITMPHKLNEPRTAPFDRDIDHQRERVERLINRVKQHRCVATRYEKRVENYRAIGMIAAMLLWL